MKLLKALDDYIDQICGLLLALSVAAMLGLTLFNIVLRWFGLSLLWIEPLVRHLVFICAFLGGAIATGKNSHIAIDIVKKILEARHMGETARYLRVLVTTFSFVVVIGLVWASIGFTQQEFDYGKEEFLGIHSGYLVGILPVGFGVIALRLFVQLLCGFDSEGKTKASTNPDHQES